MNYKIKFDLGEKSVCFVIETVKHLVWVHCVTFITDSTNIFSLQAVFYFVIAPLCLIDG